MEILIGGYVTAYSMNRSQVPEITIVSQAKRETNSKRTSTAGQEDRGPCNDAQYNGIFKYSKVTTAIC